MGLSMVRPLQVERHAHGGGREKLTGADADADPVGPLPRAGAPAADQMPPAVLDVTAEMRKPRAAEVMRSSW